MRHQLKNYSCTTALLNVTGDIIDERDKTYYIKTFHIMNYDILLAISYSTGFCMDTLALIEGVDIRFQQLL